VRRIVVGVALSVIVTYFGACRYTPPAESNGSHDGRFHTCGYVTEDGVTDHLAAYKARCGDQLDQGAP
jgi:hypothetical protein